jgi:hypothetical protein
MNKIIGLILLVILVIVVGPLLTIWSLNTLFPALAIPYAVDTWAAVVLLGAAIRANVKVNKD